MTDGPTQFLKDAKNGNGNGNGNGHAHAPSLPRARVDGTRLVCEGCGAVLESTELENLQRQLVSMTEELHAVQGLLTQKEVQCRKLRSQGDHSLRNDRNYEAAVRVLEHWRERCLPGARQLESKERLGNVLDRMKGTDGFPEQELIRCVDGYARFPFTSRQGRVAQGARKDWRADAELIFRNPQMVNQGLRLADRADALDHAPNIRSQPPNGSEPLEERHPCLSSEPTTGSQPAMSHPEERSEPSNESPPSLRSESCGGSQPCKKSESDDKSHPVRRSEPQVPSQPLQGSEPSAPSQPTNGSEPFLESHPQGRSESKVVSQPLPLSALGQAAITYAQHGWLVFPCKPGRKEPATNRGLYAAARDVPGIEKYWLTYPEMNVAIRCGSETGIVVLDIDGDIGNESFAMMQRRFGKDALPPTLMVQTPRGGHHYYFAHPGPEVRCTVGWPGSGMDIRGDGGYVLAEPSVVGGVGSYKRINEDEFDGISEMPAWLLEEIFKRQERAPKTIDTAEYEQLVQRGAAEGNRNDQLISLAGHLWSHGLAAGEVLGFVMLINKERCRPPLPSDEVEKLVMSVQRMRGRR